MDQSPRSQRYERGRMIDRGAFSQTYEYFDTQDKQNVAIKTMPGEIGRTSYEQWFSNLSKYLLREVLIQQYLHEHGGHPNLVMAKDMYYTPANTDDTSPFHIHIVMPLMEGNLHGLLPTLVALGKCPMVNRGPYLREVAVSVSYQTLMGLDYLHSAGIVHRGMMPENVLIKLGEQLDDLIHVAVTGSELARAEVGNDTGDDRVTPKVGILPYLPPEHFCFGGVLKLHPSMDIWSLGCMLFELLTGRLLFHRVHDDARGAKAFGIGATAHPLECILDVIGTPSEDEVQQHMEDSDQKRYMLDTIRKNPRPSKLRELLTKGMLKVLELADPNDPTLKEEKEHWMALIESCLAYFPSQRPTTRALLQHRLFPQHGPVLGRTVHQEPPPRCIMVVPPPSEHKARLRELIDSFGKGAVATPPVTIPPQLPDPSLIQRHRAEQDLVRIIQRHIAHQTHRVLPSMKCPLTEELFKEPVMASDGYTYEREALVDHLTHTTTSPQVPEKLLDGTIMEPDTSMAEYVRSFLDRIFCTLDASKLTVDRDVKLGEGDSKVAYLGAYGCERVAVTEFTKPELAAITHACEEARAVSRLCQHPHILRYFGMCMYEALKGMGESPHMVAELAQHGSLFDFLTGRDPPTVSLKHKVIIMIQTSSGMAQLARLNEIHGDLAARNILLFEFDPNDPDKTVVKVADFDRAQNTYRHSYVPVGEAAGPHPVCPHTSPGIVESEEGCSADDVWAFGITCLEILTLGNDYLKGVNPGKPPTQSTAGQCPEALWNILKQCFEYDRSNRTKFETLERLLTEYLTTI